MALSARHEAQCVKAYFWKSSGFPSETLFSATFPGKRDMRAELAAWQQAGVGENGKLCQLGFGWKAKAGNRPLEPKTVEKVRGLTMGMEFS